MLRRIKKPSVINKMPSDIRHHTFGLSRIIYIIILCILIFAFLNYLFYDFYMVKGDSFVDADNESIALEYTARINEVFVEDGDEVKKGQILFHFDSSEFRQQLLKATSDYSDVATKKNALDASINRLKAVIEATKTYLGSVGEAKTMLEKLKKQGNTSTDRLLTEKTREFQAFRDLLSYEAEFKSSEQAYQELDRVYNVSKEVFENMLEIFKNGEKISPVDGVIGGLAIQEGTVIKDATPIAKVYYGPRFLSAFLEPAVVDCQEGDPIIVSFRKGSFAIGRVVDIGHYTTVIPEEIKPRYRPPGRRLLARILVNQDTLKNLDIMDMASVYKPVGLGTVCAVTGCNAHLMEEYKEYLKGRSERQKRKLSESQEKNKYLHQMTQDGMKKTS